MFRYLTSTRRLAITFEQFIKLPRHPSYRIEYLDGHALITPRMMSHCAVLNLDRELPQSKKPLPFELTIAPISGSVWDTLIDLFLHAFANHPPFCDVAEATRRSAVLDCLERTRKGGDGPLIPNACGVACDAEHNPVGCVVVTKVGIAENHFERKSTGALSVTTRHFQAPHLTWICVTPLLQRHGIGCLLLAHAVAALAGEGWRALYSTFLDGNLPSVFWHWRRGFQLEPLCSSDTVRFVGIDEPVSSQAQPMADSNAG